MIIKVFEKSNGTSLVIREVKALNIFAGKPFPIADYPEHMGCNELNNFRQELNEPLFKLIEEGKFVSILNCCTENTLVTQYYVGGSEELVDEKVKSYIDELAEADTITLYDGKVFNVD